MGAKFWVEDPCVLFRDLGRLLPTKEMTHSEKLNALTRLTLIVTGVMVIMNFDEWLYFLLGALLIIVVLYYSKKSKTEGFSVTPTYNGTDFQQTTVAPLFAEEWHVPPPAYDLYTRVPYPQGAGQNTFEKPLQPQSYPYGQYLTKTNLLPSDEYYSHMGCGGARTAREYINSTFTRHDIAHRENISRIYKKKLARRYRHSNTNDSFSPFHSY